MKRDLLYIIYDTEKLLYIYVYAYIFLKNFKFENDFFQCQSYGLVYCRNSIKTLSEY